jgi:hypothetical protein
MGMEGNKLFELGSFLQRAFIGGERGQDFHCGVPRPRMN